MKVLAKSAILAALVWLAGAVACFAQSGPNWPQGYVPTPEEWQFWWTHKVDYNGATICFVSGCTMSGELITAPSTTNNAGFNLPPGTAPTNPSNGDLWMTATGGLFLRVNGSTVNLVGDSMTQTLTNKTINCANNTCTVRLGSDVTGTLLAANFGALTGDVTNSAGSYVTTISAAAVTYAKIQNVTAARLLGNPTGGAASPSEISLGSTLNFSGTTLNCTTATSSQIGCVKPDNTTITISSGTLTAVGAAATAITALVTTTSAITAGDVLASTNSGCSGTTPCLADSGYLASNVARINVANAFTAAQTITLNNLTGFTVQDATSSQDKLVLGTNSSTTCDPGYLGTPGNGPCGEITMTQNASNVWTALTLNAVNSRVIMVANGGVVNPELNCADTNAFGAPVWWGGNQAGCAFQGQARVGANQPVVFNVSNLGQTQATLTASISGSTLTVTAQSGRSIVFGMALVGAGVTSAAPTLITGTSTTNPTFCSPNCTGSGGTGTYALSRSVGTISSETMIGGQSGAEGSMAMNIWGGSLDGLTQNIIQFINVNGCSLWSSSPCVGTKAGMRIGEISGLGVTPVDGLGNETETWSLNGYAESDYAGSHLDGSYTAPTNIIARIAYAANTPELIVGGWYAPGNFAIGAFAVSGNNMGCGSGCLVIKNNGSITTGMSTAGEIYIDANGYPKYAQAAAGYNGGGGSTGNIGIVLNPASASNLFICSSNAGNGVLLFAQSASCSASSKTYKIAMGEVDDEIAAEALDRLPANLPVWRYKKGAGDDQVHVGLYAEDVEKMDHRCAVYDDNGKLRTYDDRCVIAYLVAGHRRDSAKISELEGQVSVLESRTFH